MDRETKLSNYRELTEAILAVEAINGPWREMQKALRLLEHLRDECMDGDAVFGGCEACEEPILESEMDGAHTNEDGCWFCAHCIAEWNPTT